MTYRLLSLLPAVFLVACGRTVPVPVQATGETAPVITRGQDAADDVTFWRNPQDPGRSLVIATDKVAGLHVYDLDGRELHFEPAGQVNNLDIVSDPLPGAVDAPLVVASDYNDPRNAKIAVFSLDTRAGILHLLGKVDAGEGEAYGICLHREADDLYVFSVKPNGIIRQLRLWFEDGQPRGEVVRTLRLGSRAEGCGVESSMQRLYVAEEDVALWRFDASPRGSTAPVAVDVVDRRRLAADIEGVTVSMVDAARGYLVVSSQGSNSYAVYELPGECHVGNFTITAGQYGAVEDTDGIKLAIGDFGPRFPRGLFAAQDGINDDRSQNFKLLAWQDIEQALQLGEHRACGAAVPGR